MEFTQGGFAQDKRIKIARRLKQQEHIRLVIDDDLLEEKPIQSDTPSLGSVSPLDSTIKVPTTKTEYDNVHVEITLNHPRTKNFVNLTSDKQKVLYNKLFQRMIEKLPIPLVQTKITKTFEFCKSGHIHLHACVEYSLPTGKYYPMGLIADLVKPYLSCLKQCYQDRNCFPEYQRYRSPSIACQYFNNDLTRREVWLAYIHKESYNN